MNVYDTYEIYWETFEYLNMDGQSLDHHGYRWCVVMKCKWLIMDMCGEIVYIEMIYQVHREKHTYVE